MSKLQIYTDGGSRGNPGPAGIGVVVFDEGQRQLFEASKAIGQATNNEAEYKALLESIEWLREYVQSEVVGRVDWFLDSKLVVEQVSHRWKIKEPRMRVLAEKIWEHLSSLEIEAVFHHVPRVDNAQADALVNQALDAAQN